MPPLNSMLFRTFLNLLRVLIKFLNHVGTYIWISHVPMFSPQEDDVSNSLVLQSLEEAVRQNKSLSRLKIVGRQCKWTNVATAILKGAAKSTSLTEVELVSPVDSLPSKDIIDDVRRANPALTLLLDSRRELASR